MSKPSKWAWLRTAAALSAAIIVAGCASGPTGSSNGGSTAAKAIGCALGGVGGAFVAKALAESEARRNRLTPEQLKQRERSYLIGLALVGCAGGSVLANTAYAKLSENGKRAREQELQEAARTATVRTYRDPDNPTLTGRVTPQPAFTEGNQECRVVEDVLADAGRGEPVLVKFCRRPPAGNWQQTVV